MARSPRAGSDLIQILGIGSIVNDGVGDVVGLPVNSGGTVRHCVETWSHGELQSALLSSSGCGTWGGGTCRLRLVLELPGRPGRTIPLQNLEEVSLAGLQVLQISLVLSCPARLVGALLRIVLVGAVLNVAGSDIIGLPDNLGRAIGPKLDRKSVV